MEAGDELWQLWYCESQLWLNKEMRGGFDVENCDRFRKWHLCCRVLDFEGALNGMYFLCSLKLTFFWRHGQILCWLKLFLVSQIGKYTSASSSEIIFVCVFFVRDIYPSVVYVCIMLFNSNRFLITGASILQRNSLISSSRRNHTIL